MPLAVFRYAKLSPDEAAKVRRLAAAIHELDIRLAAGAVRAGQLLARAKKLLPHGSFRDWCETEFSWNAGVVRRLKIMARFFGVPNVPLVRFSVSALRLLARSKVPQAARDLLMEEARSGQFVTFSRARLLVGGLSGQQPPQDAPAAKVTREHTLWESLTGLARGGGTVGFCVSRDEDFGDSMVSAWVADDQGGRKSVVRSDIETAVMALAGKEETKACTTCHQTKPPEAFSKKGEDGRASSCKVCERERVRQAKRAKKLAADAAKI